MAGTDRHRIYWVAGATPDDPLLDADCGRCGAQLPVEHEARPRSVDAPDRQTATR